MKIAERIDAFHRLGDLLSALPESEFQSIAETARQHNPWFTEPNIRMAVRGIRRLLEREALISWTSHYEFDEVPKVVAVVMAGNIPMVGFHDLLSVLISGHSILIKSSSKDSILMKFLVDSLLSIETRFSDRVAYAELLKNFDGIIATGSDNTARYFEYYFGKYPHIIRKNRTSIAILGGDEKDNDLTALGTDIFSYFGLGCRNVSKLYLPIGYPLDKIFRSWEPFHSLIHHHKYANNYEYQKSLFLVTSRPFLDNGFVMMEESQRLVSPIGIVYYEYYKDHTSLEKSLEANLEKIQCTVGDVGESSIRFGQAQFPSLADYADGIDTLKFLSELP